VSGILAGLSFPALILDLVPLFLFSCILVLGLLRFPAICIRIFTLFGILIQALVTIGLAVGIITFLTGIQLIPYCDTLENGIAVVLNIACVMTGIFPLLALLTKLLHKPLRTIGQKLRISDTATLGLISTLASSITTFHMIKDMDRRGIVLNAAFAVPAAFVLADPMAFTMAFHPDYLPYMMAGKMTAGILAVLLAMKFSGHRLKCTD
jgi:ethanolamine transporter